MIQSFRNKETESIWNQIFTKKIPPEIQKTAFRKLVMIARSKSLEDLKTPPSNRLEALKGDMKGKYSIRINDQWRICFSWKNSDAFDVEVIDYH